MKRKILLFLSCLLIVWQCQAQISIAEARALGVNADVTIKGIILNGGELGTIRYIQDVTGAIGIYSSTYASQMMRGDSVQVSGIIVDYQGLFELNPVSAFTSISTGNILPMPQLVTPAGLNEDTEGELVTLEDVVFELAGTTFAANTSYTFSNGSESSTVYVRTGSPLVGVQIPVGPVTLIGICSQFFATYQLLLRDEDDIIQDAGIHIVSTIETSNLSQDGFDLTWTTDLDGTTEVNYGLTPDLELGSFDGVTSTTNHQLTLTGLDAGQIYYCQVFSVNNGDTAFSSIRPYGTVSMSSGNILSYFNTSIDSTAANDEYASMLYYAIDDTLIAYIDRAEQTIDLTIYDFNNDLISNISEAINDAYDRGVRVRFISDGSLASTNTAVAELDENIQKILSPVGDAYSIMHNKFVIIDAEHEDPLKPIVWTGSTNWTDRQINRDNNSVVIVQDQTLARAYQLEFEEMWGSNGELPDTANSKFGSFKTNNTPHEFLINNKRVECYFSPSDGTNDHLLSTMAEADFNIYFATMLITRSDLANMLVNQNNLGLDVKGIVNDASTTTQYATLSTALGSDLVTNTDPDIIMHHKYVMTDHGNPDSDPTLWVGSHNWSNNANNRNDENTLVIHDNQIVDYYYQEFMARFQNMPTSIAKISAINHLLIYPNPCTDHLNILSENNEIIDRIEIFDVCGRITRTILPNSSQLTIDMQNLEHSTYFLKIYQNCQMTTHVVFN